MKLSPAVQRFTFLLPWLLALLTLGACERPFIDQRVPEIEVLEPELADVQTHSTVTLRIAATSFRTVDSVRVDGTDTRFDRATETWETTVQLHPGLNRIVITAVDVHGVTGVDTAYAVFLPVSRGGAAPQLPGPRGGHAATRLADGTVLVTGGAPNVGNPALASALVLRPNATAFTSLPETMLAARTGHTASLLPDGRVLILGGSRTDTPAAIEDLVNLVEVFDPASGTFRHVPYDGPPIRRAFHTATVRVDDGDVRIDLLGGRGDIRYGSDPRLGIRRDLAIFSFRNDSLFALTPASGASLAQATAVWGHTSTPLTVDDPGIIQRHLVAGSSFDRTDASDAGLIVDYTTPRGIVGRPAAAMRTHRMRHAAALLRPGYIAIFGGMQDAPATALGSAELYVAEVDRYFRIPLPPGSLFKRFGLTATKLSFDRILLTGGFSPNGNGVGISEVFEFASF